LPDSLYIMRRTTRTAWIFLAPMLITLLLVAA